MGTFDQRTHGFWLRCHSGSRNKSKSTQALSSSGLQLGRGQSPHPWRLGSRCPHRLTATQQLLSRGQAIPPAVRWIPAPRNPSPARPPPSSGLKAPARWGGTSGDRSGGQTASRARLRDETRHPRPSGRALSSHSRRERAGRERRRAGGRGPEGSERWPDLPLTRCLEAREGSEADRASWEENIGTCRERPVSHPLAAHQDTCPCKAARPTAHSP